MPCCVPTICTSGERIHDSDHILSRSTEPSLHANRTQRSETRPDTVAKLTIHDLEDEVWGALKARAKRKSRSLKAEVRPRPRGAANDSPASLRGLADRIAALTPDVPQTDSTELVRASRGR
jgi:plasmid stability protein